VSGYRFSSSDDHRRGLSIAVAASALVICRFSCVDFRKKSHIRLDATRPDPTRRSSRVASAATAVLTIGRNVSNVSSFESFLRRQSWVFPSSIYTADAVTMKLDDSFVASSRAVWTGRNWRISVSISRQCKLFSFAVREKQVLCLSSFVGGLSSRLFGYT